MEKVHRCARVLLVCFMILYVVIFKGNYLGGIHITFTICSVEIYYIIREPDFSILMQNLFFFQFEVQIYYLLIMIYSFVKFLSEKSRSVTRNSSKCFELFWLLHALHCLTFKVNIYNICQAHLSKLLIVAKEAKVLIQISVKTHILQGHAFAF